MLLTRELFNKGNIESENGQKIEKVKLLKKFSVWSVALYGSETWTMRKDEIDRLQAFEMWIWRRMEKINWTETR